ncbi:MAG: hypothetical protein J6V34_02565 [Oscillospiraceae bacterium]|nr:hypothetical protein [Oscillospiraceae bacterium]
MVKRIALLLLVCAMLFSMIACGQDPATNPSTNPTEPTEPSTNPTEPSTQPTEPSTNPTEPSTQPTEPSTEPTEPSTEPTEPSTQPTEPSEPIDPNDPWASYDCITIAEALALCEKFVDAPSAERYYIRATVKSIDNKTYGQMTIMDETGEIMVYGSANADGSARYDAMESKPVAGDEVLLYGTLQNYKGNTKEVQNAWIIDFVHEEGEVEEPKLPADGTELTIAEILALPIASGVTTTEHYIVKATVESIANATYGQMWITDGTGTISVYNSKAEDGTFYSEMTDKPYKGDKVTLKCTVQNFNGTMEIKQAYIIAFEHVEAEVDPSEYTSMTIAEARDAVKGTKVQVSGVVAQITYANGFIPSGVILVDETSSIYVYDGDLAARCAIGNTVSIYASKTYWVLETEQNNADKFGYMGCNQLESASVISIEETNSDFDKSWIETTTVKEIMDTPVTEDISTIIFKVTAQIKEVPGNGFTNFYINDLDGKTGSYAYSQCNGGDFTWLREFDGKICTVYLMALNAKSTAAECFWRFLPIAVVDEGFDVSTVNFAELAVKYYGVEQFLPFYSGNPALELLTSVDNDVLGLTGATLSYASSDESIISVEGNVMNCLKTGTATITITGEYNGVTYSEDVTIEVEVAQQEQTYPTVSDAIAAAVGETVTVKGVVGPSLVNRSGFYLIDETGVIAIITDADTLAVLNIGDEVVMEGVRHINTKGGAGYYGQTCLNNATLVINNYGNHNYSTAAFKGDISVEDFYNLDVTVDYSTSVFTMTATVLLEETKYYTNIYISDGTTNIRLYCSSANQYNWLKQFAGQEVTIEIAACNWNDKSYYTGCVLAVVHEDGTKTLNTLNFN